MVAQLGVGLGMRLEGLTRALELLAVGLRLLPQRGVGLNLLLEGSR